MQFCSTRNSEVRITSGEAIIKGISDDGGLFVPLEIPRLYPEELLSLNNDYSRIAARVISSYSDDFDPCLIEAMCRSSYDSGFGSKPAPVTELDDALFSLELWHGPTLAFKDLALQFVPRLLAEAKKKASDMKTSLILTATSGDTGKAALEGFKDMDGAGIMVFYPAKGVSEIQKKQMVTQQGNNLFVAAVDGVFDDAQRAVKTLMTDTALINELSKKNMRFGSANSINFGRLSPQIVYYFTAYLSLVEKKAVKIDEKINICVPSGNFGNIFAAYLAMEMGLPVNKLICASNKNDVLFEFIRTGTYTALRAFHTTISPSMDILVSSNVERLVWRLTGQDSRRTKKLYESLNSDGSFSLSEAELAVLKQHFISFSCDDIQTKKMIKTVYDRYGYLIDPHTAVGFDALFKYREQTGDTTPTVAVSAASPFKFAESVLSALEQPPETGFDALESLSDYCTLPIPEPLRELKNLPVRYDNCFSNGDEKRALFEFIRVLERK